MEAKTIIIAITNQKGGVGKTTTTMNLAAGLMEQGKKVLCLDFDPQTHLSKYLGHCYDGLPTISDFISAKCSYQSLPSSGEVIRHSTCGIDYIPSSLRLSTAEILIAQAMFRERVLESILEQILPLGYDYCLIDCNPSMGVLLTNALVAADKVLIPVQTEEFSVDGLQDMISLIHTVKSNINPKLEIVGILPTLFYRSSDCRQTVDWLKEHYGPFTFKTCIGRYADAVKSVKRRVPLVGQNGWKNGCTKLGSQYMDASIELLQRLETPSNAEHFTKEMEEIFYPF